MDKNPTTFIVPSTIVAGALRETHRVWLNYPGKHGQKYNDTVLRRFMPDHTRNCGEDAPAYRAGWLEAYREAWKLLV